MVDFKVLIWDIELLHSKWSCVCPIYIYCINCSYLISWWPSFLKFSVVSNQTKKNPRCLRLFEFCFFCIDSWCRYIWRAQKIYSQSYRLTINLWPLISFGGLKPINKWQMHKQLAFLLRTMIIPNLKHTFPSVSSDVLPERIAGHTDCNFLHCFGQMCHQRTGFRFGLSNFF